MAEAGDQSRLDLHPERAVSIDLLRGFAMFWIIGTSHLIRGLDDISSSAGAAFLSSQLKHAPWEGFTFYDHIFPLFLFVMGASLVFSQEQALRRTTQHVLLLRILRRASLLFLLGLIADGGLGGIYDENIFMGVLQRIALCYLLAATAYLLLSYRVLLIICVVTLLTYWFILTFIPLPGATEVSFAKHKNWPNYIDSYLINTFLIPGEAYRTRYDPEGLVSTLPATVNCLFGVFAGLMLKSSEANKRKVMMLLAIGAGMLLLGYLWGLYHPIIKRIWSSSYALVGGGWSFLLLGTAYLLVDRLRWRRNLSVFIWIGMNPLFIYLAVELIDFQALSARLVGGPVAELLGDYATLANSLLALLMAVLLCHFLYRRRIFIRV